MAGNKNAKHKIVVFSAPQCPFCQTIVPQLYKAAVDNPDTFALYYYHFPLLRIHPVSDIISRAMITEQVKGNFEKVIEMYTFKIDPREVNATKVLTKLNKEYNLKITEAQLNTEEVSKELKFDQEISTKSMISGTPTVYIDGIWDPSRKKYRTLYDAPKEESPETTHSDKK
jgi:protein-disulfide isomerase